MVYEKFDPPEEEYKVIGQQVRQKEGPDKVTGNAKFGADFQLPGMLHARMLGSIYAHAEIVNVDTSKAEAFPGVRAVITRKDVPAEIVDDGFYLNQPLFPDKARRLGDPIAAVAADTEAIAEEALDLIDVEYNVLTPVYDPEEALKPGAPEIHAGGNLERIIEIEIGDLELGFDEADFVIERTFNIPGVCRASIGLGTGLVNVESDGVTCYAADPQVYWGPQGDIAKVLGISRDKVQVIALYGAGNYGSKEDRVNVYAAMLSHKAKKPVRLELTRKEEMENGTRARERYYMKVGVKNDGTITAVDAKDYSSCGAYVGANVQGRGSPFFCDMYQPVNSRYECFRTFSNLITQADVRGYGHPHPSFVIETIVDEIAERLEMDPSEYRYQHLMQAPTDLTFTALGLTKDGYKESIIRGRAILGWDRWQSPAGKTGVKRRGLGMSTHLKGMGGYSTGDSCFVRIQRGGKVVLSAPSSDWGVGHPTTYAQIVAEVLRVPLDDVTTVWGNSDSAPYGAAHGGASRSMYVFGNTSYDAATDAKRLLFEQAANSLEVEPEALETDGGVIYVKAEPDRKVTFADVAGSGELVGIGRYAIPFGALERWIPITKPKTGIFYTQLTTGTCWAEVEVDTETGHVELIHIAYPYDVGTAVNPDVVYGQIAGGAMASIGYALHEGWVQDEVSGYYLNSNDFEGIKIPGPADAPTDVVEYMDTWDPASKVGATGIGEGSQIAPFSAIANAIYNAIGVRFYEIPMTPDKILKALGKV
jgi:xanthine dehydrogenase molybdenum-binding subunit